MATTDLIYNFPQAGQTTTDSTKNTSAIDSRINKATDNKDAFLQMLVAQLKNQDPMSPMDNQDFLAQMAQFSTVEELQNMSKNMTTSAEDTQDFQTAIVTLMANMRDEMKTNNALLLKKIEDLSSK